MRALHFLMPAAVPLFFCALATPTLQACVLALNYALAPPQPSILGLAPQSGAPGSVVTIFGTSFVGATAVTLDGMKVPSVTLASGFVKFAIPKTATSGLVTITTPGGTATSPAVFTVK